MLIPDPTFFHPGSWITDPNFFHPGSRIRIIEFMYFNPKKWFLRSRKYDPGCSSRIRIPDLDPDCYPSRIPDPGVKKAPVPGSGSATLTESGPDSLYEDAFYHLQYYSCMVRIGKSCATVPCLYLLR
jgi:hypothetical protein